MAKILIKLLCEWVSLACYNWYSVVWAKPARPDKVIWLSPHQIKHSIEFTKLVSQRRFLLSGMIKSGNWCKANRLDDSQIYRGKLELYRQLFLNNNLEKVLAGENSMLKRIYTDEELIWIHKKYQPLFDDIRENGFRVPESVFDKIDYFKVSIGKEGEFLFMTGKNRLSIAKVLGIKIPARISYRHTEWQAYRDRLYRDLREQKSSKEELLNLNHPDLQDLID